jgi:hypothetical protein
VPAGDVAVTGGHRSLRVICSLRASLSCRAGKPVSAPASGAAAVVAMQALPRRAPDAAAAEASRKPAPDAAVMAAAVPVSAKPVPDPEDAAEAVPV